MLLWPWCRLVVTALIGPLAWEPPYAVGAAHKMAKKKKKKTKKKKKENFQQTKVQDQITSQAKSTKN